MSRRLVVVAGALAALMASCRTDRTPDASSFPPRAVASVPLPNASWCTLALTAQKDVGDGAPTFFYDDRPSLFATSGGAIYVYQDYDKHQPFVARLDASGSAKSVRRVEFATSGEPAHVVGASQGGRVVVASTIYYREQDADLEVAMLDASDKVAWSSRVDPSPQLDADPMLAWGPDAIAVAWLRGPYPTEHDVLVALLDPKTGKTIAKTVVAQSDGTPGVPAIAWDRDAFAVAWETDVMRPSGISFARVALDGKVSTRRTLANGGSPFLLSSPAGLAIAFDGGEGAKGISFALLDPEGTPKVGPVALPPDPDPIAKPRQPHLAWDGARFAISYAVHFNASVFQMHDPESYVALIDPKGESTPPLRLNAEGDAAEMPATAWMGSSWMAVYGWGRLQKDKKPKIVAAQLACSATPTPPPAPGPCDAHESPAPEPLRAEPSESALSVIRLPDRSWAALKTGLGSRTASFLHVGTSGAVMVETPLSPRGARQGTVARTASGFAAAWARDAGGVGVATLDDRGIATGSATLDDAEPTSPPCIAWTSGGLAVAYAVDHGKELRLAMLDAAGRVARAPAKVAAPKFGASSCAIAAAKSGAIVAFTTGAAISETNVIDALMIDGHGAPLGQPARVSEALGFLSEPAIAAVGDGFVIAATGPMPRDVFAIDLDAKGGVARPERKVLSTFGLNAFGVDAAPDGAHVFALTPASILDRRLCESK